MFPYEWFGSTLNDSFLTALPTSIACLDIVRSKDFLLTIKSTSCSVVQCSAMQCKWLDLIGNTCHSWTGWTSMMRSDLRFAWSTGMCWSGWRYSSMLVHGCTCPSWPSCVMYFTKVHDLLHDHENQDDHQHLVTSAILLPNRTYLHCHMPAL